MSSVVHACPLDCPDSCTLAVEVKDRRVISVDGTHLNRLTDGFICGKVRRIAEHLYGEHRLLAPMVRDGARGSGAFRAVSWDQALDRVASELRRARDQWGGESILPVAYGGSNGFLSDRCADDRLFRRLGASRLLRTVCAAPSSAARKGMYGPMTGVAFEDYELARFIAVWGCNPHASGVHLVPIIKRATEGGARLAVIDPRATQLARAADIHIAPRPGTDLPLALALIRWLFSTGAADADFLREHATGVEELRERAEPWTMERAARVAEVDVALLYRFAELYADSAPAVIRCGWGPERNRNGGGAIAAILALPAVAGKFKVRGGGFTMSNSGAFRFSADAAAAEPEASTRAVNMNQLGDALFELDRPPLRCLFVYNANPLATLPDQNRLRNGLMRADLFTVVFDAVMTDTARYADVLLPATTFLEHDELRAGYGATVLLRSRPSVAAAGQARSNLEVFCELCRRLDLARPGDPDSPDAVVEHLLASHPDGTRLAGELAQSGLAVPPTGSHPIQFVDTFPLTSDGKIHLVPHQLDREAPGGLYHYRELEDHAFPLTLISPSIARLISSTFGQLHRKHEPIRIHPSDAATRNIRDGDRVRVHNRLGEIVCRAAIDAGLRPGVASLPKGLWSHNTENGNTANAVVPSTLTDLGGGACFNDARVEIERVD
jgi:anaerobic selenocysteine-containing dehydrogenase